MKCGPVLITSFQPWRSHQRSNSSDELIAELAQNGQLPSDSIWIRNLPVSFELAPMRAISELYYRQPRLVICCGMAEKRAYLSMEKYAKKKLTETKTHIIETAVDVRSLIDHTCLSEISYDAGEYVCNHLYYSVLEKIKANTMQTEALFVHVPLLTQENKGFILNDFLTILSQL